jgi:CheY-like chemotaxis protein
VKQSAGHVKVVSDARSGTVVNLYFPEAIEAAAPPISRESDAVRRGDGEIILLVEDEPDLLALAKRFLEELGYRVIPASNGVKAIEIASNQSRIDLVLTDLVMPGGVSGRQLARELRTSRPGIPVLFVSGYGEDIVDSEDGAVDAPVVAKPYSRSMLAAAVSDALRVHV